MHMPRRLALAALATVAGMLMLVPGVASAAPANGYYQQIAAALGSEPVYVDPAASPSITQAQAQQLDSQIKATGKPIYLVLVDNNRAHQAASSPSDFLAGLHATLGTKTAEVIGLSTSKGFYANGYNEPSAIANGAGSSATQAVHAGGSPYDVYSHWISSVSSIKVASGTGNSTSTRTANSPSTDHGMSGWLIFLIVLGIAAVLILIIVLVVRWRRRVNASTAQEARKRRINREIDSLNTSLLELSPQVTLHPEAQSDYDQAMRDVQSAIQAVTDNDLADAERYISSAKRHQARAESWTNEVDPDARPATSRRSYRYDDDGVPVSPHASGTTHVTSSQGSSRPNGGGGTVINNTVYTPQSSMGGGYQHYYGGGYYNGMYFGPGYYTDPFWTWVVMDELLDDRREDRAYEEGRRDGERDADRRDDTGTTGGDSWGGSQNDGWNTSDTPAGTTGGDTWGSGSDTTTTDWGNTSNDGGGSSTDWGGTSNDGGFGGGGWDGGGSTDNNSGW